MSSNVRSYINLIRQEFKQKNSKPLLCIRAPVFHSFWICIGLHPKIFPSLGPLEMLRFLWAPSVAARPLSVRYEWLILNVPEIYSFNIYIYILSYIYILYSCFHIHEERNEHSWRVYDLAMYNGNMVCWRWTFCSMWRCTSETSLNKCKGTSGRAELSHEGQSSSTMWQLWVHPLRLRPGGWRWPPLQRWSLQRGGGDGASNAFRKLTALFAEALANPHLCIFSNWFRNINYIVIIEYKTI